MSTTVMTMKMTSRKRMLLATSRSIGSRKPCLAFNSTIISVALISYIISSQMAALILSSRGNLARAPATRGCDPATRCSSLVILATANPVPGPAPASARSATSVSHRVPPMNGSIFGKRSLAGQPTKENTQGSTKTRRPTRMGQESGRTHAEEPARYNDIITEVIEDFMAANNEADPAEVTVAFCRVIISECNQLLNGRQKAALARRTKRFSRDGRKV